MRFAKIFILDKYSGSPMVLARVHIKNNSPIVEISTLHSVAGFIYEEIEFLEPDDTADVCKWFDLVINENVALGWYEKIVPKYGITGNDHLPIEQVSFIRDLYNMGCPISDLAKHFTEFFPSEDWVRSGSYVDGLHLCAMAGLDIV